MKVATTLVVIFFWIAIWGLFDTYTENKSKEDRIQMYLLILGIIVVIVCFFPQVLNKF
jgi:uncharacterized membrane protein